MNPDPIYWQTQASVPLSTAVRAYLVGEPLGSTELSLLREYLKQWIMADVWMGPEIPALRERVADIVDRSTMASWLEDAISCGIDPI